ncbi:MAG: hypothetical protein RI911_443 [Candidatus Parcubacteria bacterium]|jgi:hypothetical protein
MSKYIFTLLGLLCAPVLVSAVENAGAIRTTDFVVTDISGVPVQVHERTLDDIQGETAAEDEEDAVSAYISGDPGTFWSAAGHLAYVREVGDMYELIYKDKLAVRGPYKIEQLGDISSEMAYCETIVDEEGTRYVAHLRGKSYTFYEPMCKKSVLVGNELISYGKKVYVNGKDSGHAVKTGVIQNAFKYKNSIVYVGTHDAPFETRLVVSGATLTTASGLEGSLLDAAVQGGKLAYSIYKPGAGWAVMWGGEIISRWHAYITAFLPNAKKVTYVATTPRGIMLFRGDKVYGVGYDTVRFMYETPRGNLLYTTSKTSQESDRTRRTVFQDVLWFNGTKLLQSLYAQNYFAKVAVIAKKYPIVVVETITDEPQYLWYQGKIGLRGLHIITLAEDGDRVALLVEHRDKSREIVYIQKEQN